MPRHGIFITTVPYKRLCTQCRRFKDIKHYSIKGKHAYLCNVCIVNNSVKDKFTDEEYRKYHCARVRKSQIKHSDTHKAYHKQYRDRISKNLEDPYIKILISSGTDYILSPNDIPQELVELQRKSLKMKRHVWEKNKKHNSDEK